MEDYNERSELNVEGLKQDKNLLSQNQAATYRANSLKK